MANVIKTPRPPIFTMEATRGLASVDGSTVFDTPVYLVEPDTPNERAVEVAAIINSVVVVNPTGNPETIDLAVRATAGRFYEADLTAVSGTNTLKIAGAIISNDELPISFYRWNNAVSPFKTPDPQTFLNDTFRVRGLRWDSTGRYLLGGNDAPFGKGLLLWDFAQSPPLELPTTDQLDLNNFDMTVRDTAFSPDNSRVVVVGESLNGPHVAVFGFSPGATPNTMSFSAVLQPDVMPAEPARAVEWVGSTLLVGCENGLYRYSLASPSARPIYQGMLTTDYVKAVKAHPTDPNIVAAVVSVNNTTILQLYSLSSGLVVDEDEDVSISADRTIAWRPDGGMISIGYYSPPYVRNYLVDGSNQLTEIAFTPSKPVPAPVRAIDWASNTLQILGWEIPPNTYDAKLKFLQIMEYSGDYTSPVETIDTTRAMAGLTGAAISVAVDPTGSFLAVGHARQQFDLQTSIDAISLKDATNTELLINGGFEDVTGMTLSNDGRFYYIDGAGPPGWTPDSTDVQYRVFEGRSGFIVPVEGDRWLNHSTPVLVPNPDGTIPENVRLSQDVTGLTAGQTLSLRFAVTGNPASVRAWTFLWNDTQVEFNGNTTVFPEYSNPLVRGFTVPANSSVALPLEKATLRSGEALIATCPSGTPLAVNVSYVLRTDEPLNLVFEADAENLP